MPNHQTIERTTGTNHRPSETATDNASTTSTFTESAGINAAAFLSDSMLDAILDLSDIATMTANSASLTNHSPSQQNDEGQTIVSELSVSDSFVDIAESGDELNDDFVLIDDESEKTDTESKPPPRQKIEISFQDHFPNGLLAPPVQKAAVPIQKTALAPVKQKASPPTEPPTKPIPNAAASNIQKAATPTRAENAQPAPPQQMLRTALKKWIDAKPAEKTGRKGLAAQIRYFVLNTTAPTKLVFNQHRVSDLPKLDKTWLPNLIEVDLEQLTHVPKERKEAFLRQLGIKPK